jgi:4-amino-4-deoxy-L-arabinose transferase-like glycosyltransferase
VKRALWALLSINAARLALSFGFELVPQEAYYWFYSQHLALSYFDHPPAIAVLLRLSTAVLGQHEYALRLTAFTLTALTQWSFWKLSERFVPRARRGRALLLFASTGMITVLSLISLPDVPLLLFWTLSLQALSSAVFGGRRSGWIAAGLCMGLAFDSKYTGLLLQLGLVLFLLWSRPHRPLLRTRWPWLSLALAHAVMLPVYVWNAQHGFASFLFQSRDRASGGFHPGLRHFGALLASQAAVFGPLLFLALALALLRPPRRARPRQLFLAAFALPLFALCLGLSFGTLVKPNWLMPCYVSGMLLVARGLPWRLGRASLRLSAALHALAAIELLFYPVPIRSDDTWVGWRALAAQVAALADRSPGAFLFSADEYKTSAVLRFDPRRRVYGPEVIGGRGLQFAFVDTRADLEALRGRPALFIDSAPRDSSPGRSGRIPEAALRSFAGCEELDPIVVGRGARVLRKFLVYRCLDYRGPPGA